MTVRQNLRLTVPAPREARHYRERELVRLVEALAREVHFMAHASDKTPTLLRDLNTIREGLRALSKAYDDSAQ